MTLIVTPKQKMLVFVPGQTVTHKRQKQTSEVTHFLWVVLSELERRNQLYGCYVLFVKF